MFGAIIIMMGYFSPTFGLVTQQDPGTENGGLFLAQYLADNPKSVFARNIFMLKMDNAILPSGLYRRSENHNKRSVSHDEITGMMASSYILGTLHKNIIWKQLKENFGAYPAIVMDWSDRLPFNPGNYYAWGQYVRSPASYCFLLIYIVNLIIASNKPATETSSKLMYDLELRTMPDNWINRKLAKYYESKMAKQYGSDYLMKMRRIYFSTEKEEFPLFKR